MLAFLLVVLWMGAFGRAETPVKRQRGVPRDPFHQPVGQARMYQHYSYANLSEKMLETLDGSCTWKHSGDSSAVADLSVEVLRPSPVLVQRWQAQPPSQTWFDPSICVPADKFFHQVVGCTKGPALHPDCPRCHRERTEKICKLGTGKPLVIPETLKSRKEPDLESTSPWIATAHNAYVARCGGVALPCGGVITRTPCGAIRDETAVELRDRCFPNGNGAAFGLPPNECSNATVVDRLFIMSYKYDNAMGHFMTEILPRVAFYYALLTDAKRPVHIHYGCDVKYGKFSPPLKYMTWLGLDQARFVQGEAFAKEVMVPRDGACQDLMFNRWEFMKMRGMVLHRAGLGDRVAWAVRRRPIPNSDTSSRTIVAHLGGDAEAAMVPGKPVMLVLQRSRGKMSARSGDVTRIWSDVFFEEIVGAISEAFPHYQVVTFSDKNVTLLQCIECQMELFSRSTVMGSGPFSRLAMASGVHHVYHHLLKDMQQFSRRGTTFEVSPLVQMLKKVLPMIGN